MGRYAAYADKEWRFDVEADSPAEALKIADERDGSVTHVELVSDNDGGGGRTT